MRNGVRVDARLARIADAFAHDRTDSSSLPSGERFVCGSLVAVETERVEHE